VARKRARGPLATGAAARYKDEANRRGACAAAVQAGDKAHVPVRVSSACLRVAAGRQPLHRVWTRGQRSLQSATRGEIHTYLIGAFAVCGDGPVHAKGDRERSQSMYDELGLTVPRSLSKKGAAIEVQAIFNSCLPN
jgi:hypothetical protein